MGLGKRNKGEKVIKLLPGHLKMNKALKKLYNFSSKLHNLPEKFYSRFNEFDKLPKEDLDKPSVRCSGPYESEYEMRLKDNEKFDITFKTSFGKASSLANYSIPNYVSKDPSDPPILHQFRQVEKSKWPDVQGFKK